MNNDFQNNTLENFLCSARDKKLVLFGAGNEMHRMFSTLLKDSQLKPAYIVDNDFRKWYSHIFGCRIREPEVLREESPEEVVVLITSLYPFRIKEQIERLGRFNYYSSVLFVELMIGRYQFIVYL